MCASSFLASAYRQIWSRNLAAGLVFKLKLRLMAVQLDPDAELMLRVKDGDVQAFETLVDKYKQPIINLMFRMVRDLEEAEDLAQNVFVRAYQSAARYEVSAKFSTWLFTIARRLCLNELRRRGRHPAESLEAGEENEESPRQFQDAKTFSPPETFLQRELEQKIQEALDGLPEKQRVAILMCRQDEHSYDEIAKVLECSVSATKSLIHRGREALKAKLKPYLQTGAWSDDSTETLPIKRCL
jgi:RNA polymerase sigma-70 factor (ECF subfamily)